MNYWHVLKALFFILENWPAVIFAKIFNLKINRLVLKNGGSMFVGNRIKSADLSMLVEIWYYEYYNPVFMGIKENDIVFDVGANNGYFTFYAALKAKNGKVFSFEPVKDLCEKTKETAKLNNLINTVVENIAISNKNASEKFYISKEHNGCHSFFRRSESDEQVEVKSVQLENYCFDKNIDSIDFLKLDCEGAEYDIILNLSIEFIRKIKKISLEYHDDVTDHKHEELVVFLVKNNFIVDCRNGYLYALNINC